MSPFKVDVFACLLALLVSAAPVPAVASDAWLLKDVRILHLDGDEPQLLPDMAILIEDGLIARVIDEQEAHDLDVTVVDGRGRVVMPGLVDMHVHIWDEASLGAYLASGVTTVRNASGMPIHLRLAEEIERKDRLGPRLLTTGPILNSPGPNAQINHQMVVTAEEAREAVRSQHEAGYRRLKLYSNLRREAYEAVMEEAGRLGMTVMGHTPEGIRREGVPASVPFDVAFEESLDEGFVTIEHAESIVWHGLRDRHDEEAARALARRIAESGTPVDPTLLAFHNLLQVSESRGAYLEREGTALLNPLLVAQSQDEYDRWTLEDPTRHRAAFAFYERFTRMMFEEGVLLVAGSDAGIFTNVPGFSLVEELELLHGAGLDRHAVLRAATLNAAIALGEEHRAGKVAEGYRADLVLLDDDPTADLSALRSLSAVVANGTFLDREALDALLVAAATHDVERTQQNLVEGLEAQGIDPATLGF